MANCKKCKACGKEVSDLYSGYCIWCFQTVKMKKDEEKDESDLYITDDSSNESIEDALRKSIKISERKYIKKV